MIDKAYLVFTGDRPVRSQEDRHSSVHLSRRRSIAPLCKARTGGAEDPADQRNCPTRLGFFACSRAFRIELLDRCRLRPMSFVMVARWSRSRRDLRSTPTSTISDPDYNSSVVLAGWDVALMPFAMHESTQFIHHQDARISRRGNRCSDRSGRGAPLGHPRAQIAATPRASSRRSDGVDLARPQRRRLPRPIAAFRDHWHPPVAHGGRSPTWRNTNEDAGGCWCRECIIFGPSRPTGHYDNLIVGAGFAVRSRRAWDGTSRVLLSTAVIIAAATLMTRITRPHRYHKYVPTSSH